jgi:hypothetical protein
MLAVKCGIFIQYQVASVQYLARWLGDAKQKSPEKGN